MTPFNDLLAKWDQTLRTYNPVNYNRLYPSLPSKEIDIKLDALGCKDEDLRDWFNWKDGFDPDKDNSIRCMVLKFGSAPLSLEGLKGHADASRELKIWGDSFVPIATDGQGLYFLFQNEAGPDYGKLYLYCVSLLIIDPMTCYDSLSTMIETETIAYEKGILSYDPGEDWLNTNNKKYREIAKKINPQAEYWKLD